MQNVNKSTSKSYVSLYKINTEFRYIHGNVYIREITLFIKYDLVKNISEYM